MGLVAVSYRALRLLSLASMKNQKKSLRAGLLALSISALAACQPAKIHTGEHQSLVQAIQQTQVSCLNSLKQRMLNKNLMFNVSDSQRLDINLDFINQKATALDEVSLGADFNLDSKKATALAVSLEHGPASYKVQVTPADKDTTDLFDVQLDYEDTQYGVEYQQVLSVNPVCELRLNSTIVTKKKLNGNKLTIEQKSAHPGNQAGSLSNETFSYVVPDGTVSSAVIENLKNSKNLVAWVNQNPNAKVYFTAPGILLYGSLQIGKAEHVDPNSNKKSNFDKVVVHLTDGKVEALQVAIYGSDQSKFIAFAVTAGTETWEGLNSQVWNSLDLARKDEAQNTVEAPKEILYSRGHANVKLSANDEYAYDNLDQYWSTSKNAKASAPWKATYDASSIQLLAPSDSDSLVTDQNEFRFNKYLAASKMIEINDPEVQKLIAQLKPYIKQTRWQMALQVAKIVTSTITYDYSSLQNGSIYALKTSEVLARKTGVCQHFANLFATLARGVGLPTRIVMGYLVGPEGMGMHAWNEIEVSKGKWIPVEPQQSTLLIFSGLYLPLTHGTYLEDGELSAVDIKSMQMRFDYKLLRREP